MNCSCWSHAFFVQFKTTSINNFKLHNDQFDITGKFHFEIRTNFKSQKNCQSFLIIIITIIFRQGTSKEILLSPPELPKIWSLGFFEGWRWLFCELLFLCGTEQCQLAAGRGGGEGGGCGTPPLISCFRFRASQIY